MAGPLPPAFADYGPSVKFVYYVLEDHNPTTKATLRAYTALPETTLRNALETLEADGHIEQTESGRSEEYQLVEGQQGQAQLDDATEDEEADERPYAKNY